MTRRLPPPNPGVPSTRRKPHDRWHDAWVLTLAVLSLLAGWWLWNATEAPEPEPTPQRSVPAVDRHKAAQSVSRSAPRTTPPLPTGDPLGLERQSRGRASDPVGRSVQGKPDLPAVLKCIREAESGGDYQAENPTSSASGAWQFIDSTWESTTGLQPPASAYSRKVQDKAALKLYAGGAGLGHWVTAGGCS